MYKIIGADGKEYGPVSADDLRKWIAEGRVNAQTQILLEGTTDWKPLSQFAEFAASGPAAPAPLAPLIPPAQPADAASRVSGPATGLIVVAVLGFLFTLLGLVFTALGSTIQTLEAFRHMPKEVWGVQPFSGAMAIASHLVQIAVSGLILWGGLKMRRLENYGLAMAASVVAMIPCLSPCCLIGLPVGIWALVTITKPEIKGAFREV